MSESKTFDDVMAAYFQSEAPKPWPRAPRIPADLTTVATPATLSRPSRSRAALTASVLALLVGGWFLAGRISRMPERPANFDGTTATRPAELTRPK